MIWPTMPILEEEFKDDEYELSKRFIKSDEDLHDGTTFIFENEEKSEVATDENKRYFQFKTVIEENDQNYFIYDEVIQINEKPVLLLRIHNDETKEIWEQIIYFENNKVVEQVRRLTYEQFFSEMRNNDKILRSEEDSSTTIIRTPFLEFIENINQEKNEFNKQKPMKKVWWKRVPWKILGLVVFIAAWAAIPVIGNLLIAPLLVGVVSTSVMTWLPFVTAGLITGSVVAGFNRYRTRLKKWLFPKWKSKSEINLENKLEEQRIMLEKNNRRELFLTATSEVKQEKLLNSFQDIWNKNKSKSFATIQTELNEKFENHKQEVQKQEFAKTYVQKISEWNKNWREKAEFSRTLAPEDIAKIKETFAETEETGKIMCDGYCYQPEPLWTAFQKEQSVKNGQNLCENSEKNDILERERDMKKKSPVKSMTKLVA